MGSGLKRIFGIILISGVVLIGIRGYAAQKKEIKKESRTESVNDLPAPSSSFLATNIQIQSRAAVVINADSGQIITAYNAFQVFPIASLTKLMSSMVSLDNGVKLDNIATIPASDFKIGGNLRIAPDSETVTNKDLLYASITGSANNAALSFARATNLPEKDFVDAMNRKAVELGLETLHYEEASGLSPKNTGSAYDVARLAGVSFSKYPLILDAASKGTYKFHTTNTNREHTIKNPNKLFLTSPGSFLASKTGYLDEALYCLVLAKKNSSGMLVAVTLGNPSSEGSESETLKLLLEAEKKVAGGNL